MAGVPNTSFEQFSETIHKTQKQGRGSFDRASPSKPHVLYSPSPLPPLVVHKEGHVYFPVGIVSLNETDENSHVLPPFLITIMHYVYFKCHYEKTHMFIRLRSMDTINNKLMISIFVLTKQMETQCTCGFI